MTESEYTYTDNKKYDKLNDKAHIVKIAVKRFITYDDYPDWLADEVDSNGVVVKGGCFLEGEKLDKEDLRVIKQNQKRLKEWENGEWFLMGIKAYAEIVTPTNSIPRSWLKNTIYSGGLYGIESDSQEKYIKDEEDNQIYELKKVLVMFGFNKKVIDKIPIIREHSI